MTFAVFLTPRARMLAVASLAGIALALVISIGTPTVTNLDFRMQDWLIQNALREQKSDAVLVGIDEASMNLTTVEPEEVAASRALQLMQQGYPWSREVYAIAARQLLEAGARVVVFDIVFPGEREGDDALAQVLRDYPGRIVQGCSVEPDPEKPGRLNSLLKLPAPLLLEAAPQSYGFVNLPDSADGIVRQFHPWASVSLIRGGTPHPGEENLPALSTLAAQSAGYPVPETTRLLRFRYLGRNPFPVLSLYELFVPALLGANYGGMSFFKDKIVLIGATAGILQDFHLTPLGRMAGPAIQLNIIEALKDSAFYGQCGFAGVLASIVIPGLFVYLLVVLRKTPRWFVAGWLSGAAAWILVCLAVFAFGHFLLPMAYPFGTWLLCGFLSLACDVSWERRERGRLRSMLERYVSRDVVREIVENPISFLQTLGGQRKEVTVLFSDLQGFTAESELLDPSEMVALLNGYFAQMVDTIFEHQGTLDKFIGDALMATWGCISAGGSQDDARQAVEAAWEMQDRLAALNAERGGHWGMGIGICQGPAVFGNIGSQQKMEPTVIGDTVNLASRIEGLTRVYGCPILINEQAANQLSGHFPVVFIDAVRVKGRKQAVRLFFPYRTGGPEETWIQAFQAARTLYENRRYSEAAAAFAAIASGPARCFASRCQALQAEPPSETWDGIWEFTSK